MFRKFLTVAAISAAMFSGALFAAGSAGATTLPACSPSAPLVKPPLCTYTGGQNGNQGGQGQNGNKGGQNQGDQNNGGNQFGNGGFTNPSQCGCTTTDPIRWFPKPLPRPICHEVITWVRTWVRDNRGRDNRDGRYQCSCQDQGHWVYREKIREVCSFPRGHEHPLSPVV